MPVVLPTPPRSTEEPILNGAPVGSLNGRPVRLHVSRLRCHTSQWPEPSFFAHIGAPYRGRYYELGAQISVRDDGDKGVPWVWLDVQDWPLAQLVLHDRISLEKLEHVQTLVLRHGEPRIGARGMRALCEPDASAMQFLRDLAVLLT